MANLFDFSGDGKVGFGEEIVGTALAVSVLDKLMSDDSDDYDIFDDVEDTSEYDKDDADDGDDEAYEANTDVTMSAEDQAYFDLDLTDDQAVLEYLEDLDADALLDHLDLIELLDYEDAIRMYDRIP